MDIKQLKLENLGRFQSLDIDFAPTDTVTSNVTVLIGNNGAGKTSILRSLATSLSWFVARLRSDKGSGSPLPEEVILNGTSTTASEIVLQDHGTEFSWSLTRTRKGRKGNRQSQLNEASKLADKYRMRLADKDSASLPLIAFYPVERVVLDIPLKIKERHTFQQLDGYDNSLNQGVDFRRFFEWFREREDIENEREGDIFLDFYSKNTQLIDDLMEIAESASSRLDKMKDFDVEALNKEFSHITKMMNVMKQVETQTKDPQLNAVRSAIESFMPGFSNLRVRRKPRLHMSIDKEEQTLNVLQLSQGEKSLMALVGDIARRLAMMNPDLENPLHGDGVVLVDEIDMHLHPQWARTIISRLTKTFPNCQFILTTHSPLVISDCKDVLVYSLDNGNVIQVPSQYGQDANSVLLNIMDTHVRNEAISKQLNDFMDLVHDKKLDDANVLFEKLAAELPADNLELTKARLLLRKEALRREKN